MKTLSSILLSDITFLLDIYFSILASITDNPTLAFNLWFESLKVVIILRCIDLTYLYNFIVWFTIYFIFFGPKVEKEGNASEIW